MRFGYFAYRAWAFELLGRVLRETQSDTFSFVATTPQCEIDVKKEYPGCIVFDPSDKAVLPTLIRDNNIDVAFLYGWSWMVPKELTDRMDCLCLHPSLLPRYRGGTPFQHQIMNNEQSGGLTIFRMNDEMDGGDMLEQRPFSLQGTLADILGRVVEHGAEATVKILSDYEKGTIAYKPQKDLDTYPPYKRRKPQDSEIKFSDLASWTVNNFYNFVRALDDPFPNCYIVLDDGAKLFLQRVELVMNNEKSGVVFDGSRACIDSRLPLFIQTCDGFVQLVHWRLSNNDRAL